MIIDEKNNKVENVCGTLKFPNAGKKLRLETKGEMRLSG
jgi:hypothetical protein